MDDILRCDAPRHIGRMEPVAPADPLAASGGPLGGARIA